MKAFCCMVAAAGLLIAVPALAQQANGSVSGTTNIWSSAQGTSNSYGDANGFGLSSSGATANAGGRGPMSVMGAGAGGLTSATTTSNAGVTSFGSGYAQAQTSGYSGGSVSGYAGRGR